MVEISKRSICKINAPHIIQPRPPLPLLRPLHNLHALHVRTEHLDPHLHAHPRQLVPQQERRVDPPRPDVQTHPRKGVPGLEGHPQNVAHLDAARVAPVVEEGFAFTGRVEGCELRFGHGGDGVFAFREGGRGWGVDFEFLLDCIVLAFHEVQGRSSELWIDAIGIERH